MTTPPGLKIKTFSGLWIDPMDPNPADVALVDVAHGLALTCRFAGHVRVPYSVAEHCVRMSHAVPEDLALDALVHDCAEAYITDLSAPIKRRPEMQVFRDAEDRLEAVIREALKLDGPEHDPRIKPYDEAMFVSEARDLMNMDVQELRDRGYPEPLVPETIIPWPWEVVKQMWLDRYEELRR